MESTRQNIDWLKQQLFTQPCDPQLLTIELFQEADNEQKDIFARLILPHVEEPDDSIRYLSPGLSGAAVLLIVPNQRAHQHE